MNFLKKNVKLIAGILIGATLATGITAYATYSYFANNVSYTKPGTQTEISVEDALNDLYSRTSNTQNILLTTYINILNNGLSISDGLIPILTSNTGSNGEAFCNTPIYSSNYDAYKVFDGNISGSNVSKSWWTSYVLENNYGYIGYRFNQATEANSFYVNTLCESGADGVLMHEFVLQASNDNSTWVDLTETINQTPKTTKYYKITKNKGSYTYYRLYGKSQGVSSAIAITELQLFNI